MTVFDPILGASVVQDLGLNYSQFLEAAVTPDAGLTLNFSVDMSVFTQVGSNLNNLRYTVFAGDAVGNFTSTGVMVTAALGLPSIHGLNSDVTGMFGSSGAAQVFTQWQNLCGAAAASCTGTGFGASGVYAGGLNWGERFGNFLDVDGSGAVGQALGFYFLTRSAATASTPLNSLQYANAAGPAQWLLSSNGALTYSVAPVPLPAAAWLLLSGLAGLGVVGRRKARA